MVRWLTAISLGWVAGWWSPAHVSEAQSSDTELAYFQVTTIEGGVATIEWGTISEAGAVGFKVDRSTEPDGFHAPIAWEEAVGAPSSRTSYVMTDALAPETTYWYWLSDVNVFGVEQALTTPITISTGLRPVEMPLLHRLYLNLILR